MARVSDDDALRSAVSCRFPVSATSIVVRNDLVNLSSEKAISHS